MRGRSIKHRVSCTELARGGTCQGGFRSTGVSGGEGAGGGDHLAENLGAGVPRSACVSRCVHTSVGACVAAILCVEVEKKQNGADPPHH